MVIFYIYIGLKITLDSCIERFARKNSHIIILDFFLERPEVQKNMKLDSSTLEMKVFLFIHLRTSAKFHKF